MRLMLEKIWYGSHPFYIFLLPFSGCFRFIAWIRRVVLSRISQKKPDVPLIVVGNITVGGVGKTPLVIALAQAFIKKGVRVGIVSRGYGAQANQFPLLVKPDSEARWVGDEPLLLARRCACPVVIGPKRNQAVALLVQQYQCQLIISDDGLQHYAMGRTLEIAVVDGQRGVGNGHCLPAGPLREPVSRLKSCDMVVVNGVLQKPLAGIESLYRMTLIPGKLTSIKTGQTAVPGEFDASVAAVAAIGNPARFYATLTQLGLDFKQYSFPDHHFFSANELQLPEKWVVMTEKDAVKCYPFAAPEWYYLPVEASLDADFWQALYRFFPVLTE